MSPVPIACRAAVVLSLLLVAALAAPLARAATPSFSDQTVASGLISVAVPLYDLGSWCCFQGGGGVVGDFNNDGWQDVFHPAGGGTPDKLFINNGDGTFSERADAFGLDFAGYGTQAAFFDYDLDGDLDAYLLNHSIHAEETYGPADLRYERHPRAGDRLYRNESEGRFVDISAAAGIYGGRIGYGLGVSITDVDVDGCPDIYVANDFHENDYLYINNCDGTFTESIRQYAAHTSRASMGSDAADVNNDGYPDIVVLDMMPAREDIRKTAAGTDPLEIYERKVLFGYHHHVARNTLLLNLGGLRLIDVAPYAGVEATDWSWAPLLADFDGDGWKDLFVSNGILRRPNDLEYIEYASQTNLGDSLDLAAIDRMPSVAAPNHVFRNRGDLTFEPAEWGLDEPLFSTGAAYADLDNDGDLDIILNNIDALASIYENRSSDRHWISFSFGGEDGNRFGVGTRVEVHAGGLTQVQENFPTRGFQSSVPPLLHFGLADADRVDSILVMWPGGRSERLLDQAVDTLLTVYHTNATPASDNAAAASAVPDSAAPTLRAAGAPMPAAAGPTFRAASIDIDFRHAENTFYDYTTQPLLPHMVSTEGPGAAVGDVNGDGLDDLWVGGAKWQPAALFIQSADGSFASSEHDLWRADSLYEDVDAAFFDADGDGDLDLYVVTAGNEFTGEAEALRDRLYLNDGSGVFQRSAGRLPDMFENGSVVRPSDFDGDGDVDLFVGSHVITRDYGRAPRSFLLRNDGNGHFADATGELAPELTHAGLVTDAEWTDVNADGAPDLVLAGEWMRIRVLVWDAGRLSGHDAGLGDLTGWWSAVHAADLDADGDDDLILGNFGLNAILRPSEDQPVRLYVGDLDASGSTDHVLTFYREGTEVPVADRDRLLGAIPSLARRYPTYSSFGDAEIGSMFDAAALREADVMEAKTFTSVIALNRGDGTFDVHELPAGAQQSPIRAILTDDYNGDGVVDIVVAGNFFDVHPDIGRADASYGVFLRGLGAGAFAALWPHESGLLLDGQVRQLRSIHVAGLGKVVVAVRNGDRLQFVALRSGDT